MASLDEIIASNLRTVLEPLRVGETIPDSTHLSNALNSLERYLPAVFAELYPEWKHEGLDGFIPLYVRKCLDREMELFGLCWLIDDQSQTPLRLHIQIHTRSDEIAFLQCKLGERGESGMVRLKVKSKAQYTHLHQLEGRENSIDWIYKVQLGCRTNDAWVQRIMRTIIKDEYLELNNENYMQLDRDFTKPRLQEWLDQLTESDVEQLLCAEDWRAKLVGIHCVLQSRNSSLAKHLKAVLVSKNYPLVKRSVCLALALIGDKKSADLLVDFLQQPVDYDLLDAYAGALVGLEKLGISDFQKYRREIIRQFRGQDFFDEQLLRDSEAQFVRALDYWK